MYLLGYSHQIRTFNVDYSDLVNCYGISVSPMITNMLRFFVVTISSSLPVMTCHWILIQSNTTGVTSGTGTAFLSGAHQFTQSIQWRSFCSIFYVLLSTIVCLFCTFSLGRCIVCPSSLWLLLFSNIFIFFFSIQI